MIINGFFSFGALNGYKTANMDGNNFISAYGLKWDSSIISKTNAKSKIKESNILSVQSKCSCSLYKDYKMHSAKWVNYCPQCHKYGTLKFTKGGDSPEGMIYCTNCDADFCGVHGKEHVYGRSTYLRHA